MKNQINKLIHIDACLRSEFKRVVSQNEQGTRNRLLGIVGCKGILLEQFVVRQQAH